MTANSASVADLAIAIGRRLKRVFYVARAWLWVRLRRDVPAQTCISGKCWCVAAEHCAFKRCMNCDGCIGDDGKTLDDAFVEEWKRCPYCGGKI